MLSIKTEQYVVVITHMISNVIVHIDGTDEDMTIHLVITGKNMNIKNFL